MENSIRALRRQQGLSQDDIARITHVSRQTINAVENDKYDPELTLAFRLAQALNTTVDTLFDFSALRDQPRKRESDVFWCEKYKCVLWQRVDHQEQPS